jgi:hypothetical protein
MREGIDSDAPIIDVTERGVRAVVKRTAERAADQTDNGKFQSVSSHDLQQRFTQRFLVDQQMNPRVVMGGRWMGLLSGDRVVSQRAIRRGRCRHLRRYWLGVTDAIRGRPSSCRPMRISSTR